MTLPMRRTVRVITRTLALLSFAAACEEPAVSPVGDIIVSFPGTNASDPALLLYTGVEAGACVTYEAAVANPTVTLHDVAVGACAAEFDAFAPGFGAYARGVDPADATDVLWLNAAIDAGSIAISLPGPTIIPLQIWLVGLTSQTATMESVRDRLLNKAYPVLETFATGFTLDTATKRIAPLPFVPKCSNAGLIAADPTIYDGTKINVYFVADYGNIQGLTPAYNCWQESHPEIAFVSWKNSHVTDPTLVHELAHSLGLIHPKVPLGGHTYAVPGFDPFNLMATNTDVTDVTIGQLYAMNFSTDSWINRSGSVLSKPVVKTCQDDWLAGECPALTVTKAGWPP